MASVTLIRCDIQHVTLHVTCDKEHSCKRQVRLQAAGTWASPWAHGMHPSMHRCVRRLRRRMDTVPRVQDFESHHLVTEMLSSEDYVVLEFGPPNIMGDLMGEVPVCELA
jgi:hypothetical protein